jgi:Flp pilus assembly protein TadB
MGAVPACILMCALSSAGVAAFLIARLALASVFAGRAGRGLKPAFLPRGWAYCVLGRVPLVSKALSSAREARYAHALRKAMPEAVRLLCIALDAGSSLVNALEYTARTCDEPLAGELSRVVWDLQAGQGFDEAMRRLSARTGGTEFSYLAVAMEIQHRSGGSLKDVLQSVSSMLQQDIKLKQDLRAKTAQARLSARVVACMPVVLLLVLSLLTQGYLAAFFTSPLGLLLFFLACALEALGVVLVRKGLHVDLAGGMAGAA